MQAPVELLPSRSLQFSGACHLNVTSENIYLVDPKHHPLERRRVSWPISAVSYCGFQHKLLLLRTKESV